MLNEINNSKAKIEEQIWNLTNEMKRWKKINLNNDILSKVTSNFVNNFIGK